MGKRAAEEKVARVNVARCLDRFIPYALHRHTHDERENSPHHNPDDSAHAEESDRVSQRGDAEESPVEAQQG